MFGCMVGAQKHHARKQEESIKTAEQRSAQQSTDAQRREFSVDAEQKQGSCEKPEQG